MDGHQTTHPRIPTHPEACHLIFDRYVENPKFISAKLMELFSVRRLVFMKKSLKEKHILKSAVMTLNGSKSVSMFERETLYIDGVRMQVHIISNEDAEDLIDQKRTKVYVGNIPHPVGNLDIWTYFSQFGKIDYSYILKKPVWKGARGFGFVIYENRASVQRAIAQKNFINGVKLNCKEFLNKSKIKKDDQCEANKLGQVLNYEGYEQKEEEAAIIEEDEDKVSRISKESTEKCGSVQGEDHSDKDHCKECCDECHLPVNDQEDNRIEGHVSRHLEDDERELPEVIPGSEFINMIMNGELEDEPSEITPKPAHRTLKQAREEYIKKQSQKVESVVSAATDKSILTKIIDSCECTEDSCNKCWSELLDSEHFCPPCILCDISPSRPSLCVRSVEEMKPFIWQETTSLFSPPHRHVIEPCVEDDCEKCSFYQTLKKKIIKTPPCCQYKLFNVFK